jgi:hypothetical protein
VDLVKRCADKSRNGTQQQGATVVHAEELQAIRALVTNAALPANIQESILASFDRLPRLYESLSRTYESRFADHIRGSVEGMVRILAAKDGGPNAPQLAATIVNRMREMHDRFGVAVALKPPPAPKATPKKKSA